VSTRNAAALIVAAQMGIWGTAKSSQSESLMIHAGERFVSISIVSTPSHDDGGTSLDAITTYWAFSSRMLKNDVEHNLVFFPFVLPKAKMHLWRHRVGGYRL
ncbi:MAG TPA: hypothetical protein VKA97_13210, partial [Pyrinomonadaceae bacterium]|nr:hypothetical protein [Pyrinomonadaceae bacterium]